MNIDPAEAAAVEPASRQKVENLVMLRHAGTGQGRQKPEQLSPTGEISARQFADDEGVAKNSTLIQKCGELIIPAP